MLKAMKVGALASAYDLTLDGQPVARWDASTWRSGGAFTLHGVRYSVRSNMWGTEFVMTDASGSTVATAGKLNRRQWTVVVNERTYDFRRKSWWRNQYDLWLGGRPAGFVRRSGGLGSPVDADLPTIPLAAQVFVLGVALATWDAAAIAAITGSTTATT